MDKFHLINVFVAVCDAEGFSGAARKLKLSPPAITRAINELEAHLGLRLLVRTTRSIRVTEAGLAYAQDCRRILNDMQEADESVLGQNTLPRGRLTITAPSIFGSRYITPIVTEYLTAYPEVSASCLFFDRVANLIDEGIDLAIRIGDLPDSSMQAISVGKVKRVICASPDYLKQFGEPRTADELQQHRIISASNVTPNPEWKLIKDGKIKNVRLDARMITSTNDAAIYAALSGFGLTRLLCYQVADHLVSGALKTVLQDYEPPSSPVHLLHRAGRNPPQRVRAFLDLAVERLRCDLNRT